MPSLSDITVSSSFDIEEVEACVRRWGAAVLPGWLDRGRLDGLRHEFVALFDDGDQPWLYRFGYSTGRGVSLDRQKAPRDRYPAIIDVFSDPNMAAMADRYVGRPHLLNYEVYATHDFLGSGIVAPTHFDKLWTLKFMIYLENVGAGDVPFGVVPGSGVIARARFRQLFENGAPKVLPVPSDRYLAMNNDRIPEDAGEVVDILAPAGSLIVFDTDTFHRAGHLAQGHQRKVLRGHSGPAATYDKVRKGDRQWWRGEERPSRWQMIREKLGLHG